MSADSIVKSALSTVPKAMAAGVVDMASGLMLSIKTVESHPQKVLDILAPRLASCLKGRW
ncbi:MAG TPA: hypothetical protein VGK45_12890 [Thermoanaerobaculia bacterium]